jgi:2-phosphoglycolate phosphatase
VTSQPNRLLGSANAILFDLDGTMLDTAPDLVNAVNLVCAEQAVTPPDFDTAARQVSNGAIGLTRLAFPDADEATQTQLCARLVELYAENICIHTKPYPGMLEVLDHLNAENIPWGVVTNKMHRLALPILKTLGLYEHCKTLVGGDTAARNKPHPDPILHALDELGYAAESVVYVGDHRKDVQAGQAAGTRTVAVTWGYTIAGEDPVTWGADYTIDLPDELLELTI